MYPDTKATRNNVERKKNPALTFPYYLIAELSCLNKHSSIHRILGGNSQLLLMKKYLVPCILLLFIMLSSFQCEKCYETPNTQLGDNRNWLPLIGKTSLQFISDNGSIRTFPIKVTDTVMWERYQVCEPNNYESLIVNMTLDSTSNNPQPKSLLIELKFHNKLSVKKIPIDINSFHNEYWPDVLFLDFNTIKNFQLNNYIYSTGVLLKDNNPQASIDSIYLAKYHGIVGFKYKGVKYVLQ